MDNEPRYVALYSKKADEQFGHVVWERASGERVVCTAVVPVGVPHDFYKWPDKEDRGEVVRWVASRTAMLLGHECEINSTGTRRIYALPHRESPL